ncbi:hypothetical protein CMV_019597 [Castanea mollissima]|uniref:Uncharacterized protein n=1 Tax=Castanea mollissima TaxID=60419 RepID=A0A8J4QY64_9ROSI|nr:hypothetical protein CMV_019597 [Castanea mollissima]
MLDCLLLLQSNLLSLIHQINELVVQTKEKEIELFTYFFPEMLSSLKSRTNQVGFTNLSSHYRTDDLIGSVLIRPTPRFI